MTKEQCDFICKAMNYCELEHHYYESYSGRGMYGEETAGVVVNNLLDVIGAVTGYMKSLNGSNTQWVPQLDDLNTDNMGKDIILY